MSTTNHRRPWQHPEIFHFADVVNVDQDENSTYLSLDIADIGREELQFSIERRQEHSDDEDEVTILHSAGVDSGHIQLLRDLLTDWLVKIGKE